jgi:hypothetical protein
MLGEWDEYGYANLRSLNMPAFETKTLSREELGEWNKKAYTSFYLRLGYVWKRLKNTRSLGELRTNIAGLYMLTDLII